MSVCLVHSIDKCAGKDKASNVIGCIEEYDDVQIKGWVFSASGDEINLVPMIRGTEVSFTVEWVERPDVVEKYGEHASFCGFVVKLVVNNKTEFSIGELANTSISIYANDVCLNWNEKSLEQQTTKPLESESIKSMIGSNIDSLTEFVLKGWALRDGGVPCQLNVFVNEQEVVSSVARVERKDVARKYGVTADKAGFEIFLPGYMWELCEPGEGCSINILADGESILTKPLYITRKDATEWVCNVAKANSGDLNDFAVLHALEHVRYGDLYNGLPGTVKAFYDESESRYGLDGYASEEKSHDCDHEYALETVGKIALRTAMSELNELLGHDEDGVYEKVKLIYEKHALRGVAKEWYLNLAIQLTCANGDFERLYELTDFKYLDSLKGSRQPHQLALLLPVLVSQGEVEQAASVIRQISKCINSSWLQTECLGYAVRYVRKLEMNREIDVQVAEKVRSAFFGVLDGMKGEWYSRLHDQQLVSTVVYMLTERQMYTDYHRQNIIEAAIRHYGLSPCFWELLSLEDVELPDFELKVAHKEWVTISGVILKDGEFTDLELQAALDSLGFFIAKGNHEANIFKRELLAKSMAHKSDGRESDNGNLQEIYTRYHADETLRYAAYPIKQHQSVMENQAKEGEVVSHVLRSLSGYQKSAVYGMQIQASNALKSMWETLILPKDDVLSDVEALFIALEKRSTLLGNKQGMFLGVDLLLSGYKVASAHGYQPSSVLMRVSEMIKEAIDYSTAVIKLPAPICAALSRIRDGCGDRNIECLLAEMQNYLVGKFGRQYEYIFSQKSNGGMVPESSNHFDDTLVLIEVPQTGSEINVSNVRNTWLKRLQAKGVPYLFVMCGDEEYLENDVLNLKHHDVEENRPDKTLRMFEWVLEHTNAQYVLKVDSDCYLDVDKYFETLSYRKFHYYGKIVRCVRRNMDREWHQKICKSDYARKSLDKSPGESVFASGEVGYSLSRYALLKMAESAKTDKGKRMVASSFAEDKMVGDLLAMAKIMPVDEDFDVYSSGCSIHKMLPSEVQDNAFIPGGGSLCKVAKCGMGYSLQDIERDIKTDELWPKKIWPTYLRPSIGANSNQLELITDSSVVKNLLNNDIVVVSVVRNEMTLLPQFLSYYRNLGVKCFIFVDNCSDDGSREYLVQQEDVVVYSARTEYKRSHYGVSWQQAVLGNHCLGKWVLLADADEFLVYEDCENQSIESFVEKTTQNGANGVLLYMIDMYPYHELTKASFDTGNVFEVAPYFDKQPLIELRFGRGMYSNSRNYVNGLRHRIAPSRINAYVSQKYALFKYYPWIRLSEGVHYSANMKISSSPAFFAHFKYHSGFKDKVEMEVRRKQHFNGAEEYKKYASVMPEIAGGFGVEGVSEKYLGSESFHKLIERYR